MLPSVTMSRPAAIWSSMTVLTASVYASSCATSLKATRTSRPSSCCLNHPGRGYDPTMVVGRILLTTFFVIFALSVILYRVIRPRPGDAVVYVNAIGVGYSRTASEKAAASPVAASRWHDHHPPRPACSSGKGGASAGHDGRDRRAVGHLLVGLE